MNRKEIVETLRTHVVSVTFNKADGTRRVMRCTLRPDLLPPKPPVTEQVAPKRATSEDLVVAYDLDKNAFRSFNIDRVESIEYD